MGLLWRAYRGSLVKSSLAQLAALQQAVGPDPSLDAKSCAAAKRFQRHATMEFSTPLLIGASAAVSNSGPGDALTGYWMSRDQDLLGDADQSGLRGSSESFGGPDAAKISAFLVAETVGVVREPPVYIGWGSVMRG
jgi:hypothetical protein